MTLFENEIPFTEDEYNKIALRQALENTQICVEGGIWELPDIEVIVTSLLEQFDIKQKSVE